LLYKQFKSIVHSGSMIKSYQSKTIENRGGLGYAEVMICGD
jgi:hypothetical protein